ncbi:MAG: flagellar biosynthetic protein FliO [Polyangiaceae bacterium]
MYPRPVSPGAYFAEAALMLLTLTIVLGAVVVVSRRWGIGGTVGPLELVGRLPLDPRRAIYLVRVGPQVLVVGASDGGLVKLSEMAADDLPPAAKTTSALDALRSVVSRSSTGEGSP